MPLKSAPVISMWWGQAKLSPIWFLFGFGNAREFSLSIPILILFLLGSYPMVQGAPPPQSERYNVIFVSITNTRADHLGVYGYQRNTSPQIDHFAGKSLVFQNAFSHASWTLPVVMSLFTSQYPFAHGMMNREMAQPLPATVPTFVDILNKNGYRTAAFVGGRDYDPTFGHTSRFQEVLDVAARNPQGDWKQYGVLEHSMPPALQWLRTHAHGDQPFLLLIQGYDTHCPFALPHRNSQFDPDYRGAIDFTRCYWTFEPTRPITLRTPAGQYEKVYTLKTKPITGDDYEERFFPEDVKHMVALYDGEIFNADQLLGRLFHDVEELGLEKNTIVILYSDHGDMFGKHGRFMRGGPLRGTFYDDVLRMPLIIHHPKLPPGNVSQMVQIIDIAPTLLDWLGLPRPQTFRGRSFHSIPESNAPINEIVFAGSEFTPSPDNPFFRHRSLIVSARDRQWKFIWEKVNLGPGIQDQFELYDLRRDPAELANQATKHPETVRQYKDHILAWIKTEAPASIQSQFP